jgi:starch phosphorylase
MAHHVLVAPPNADRLLAELRAFDSLATLAFERRWSWTRSTAALWRRLDPELWELTHNPLVILRTISRPEIQRVLADAEFQRAVNLVLEESRRAARAPAWLRESHPDAPRTRAAYFCAASSSC